ncbi:hypothetical protein RRF57_008931 [Xylaria bambusicola]|uniref:Large ribosomal subunit protein uL23m n=1 Tax=Xylaria bambusicola TaxID=326684 RepID=A0AAN7Z8N4_9PEZI
MRCNTTELQRWMPTQSWKMRECQRINWTLGGIAYISRRPAGVVRFLAPKPNQHPTFARFEVPLNFNKFDLRDYLLHAYRTPVLSVRSHLRQQRPRKYKYNTRIFRPPPIKEMTVQLAQPFEWPSLPDDVSPWKPDNMAKAKKAQLMNKKMEKDMEKKSLLPLRDQTTRTLEWKNMRQEAKRLLEEGGWSNKRDLDVRFTEKEGLKKK